jgi:hypothetical protein
MRERLRASQNDRFDGRIAPGSRDHRDAARRTIHGFLDQPAVLVDVHRRRLARRPDDDDSGGAVRNVKVDQLRERRQIERAAGLHRCDDRDQTS